MVHTVGTCAPSVLTPDNADTTTGNTSAICKGKQVAGESNQGPRKGWADWFQRGTKVGRAHGARLISAVLLEPFGSRRTVWKSHGHRVSL